MWRNAAHLMIRKEQGKKEEGAKLLQNHFRAHPNDLNISQ
jgi:hypothetical protein